MRIDGVDHPPKWGRSPQSAQLLYRNKGPAYASPFCPAPAEAALPEAYAALDFGGAGPTGRLAPNGRGAGQAAAAAAVPKAAASAAETAAATTAAATAAAETATETAAETATEHATAAASIAAAAEPPGGSLPRRRANSSHDRNGDDIGGLGCHVDHHPSAAGMYLHACVVFATLFGVSPVGAAPPRGECVGSARAWAEAPPGGGDPSVLPQGLRGVSSAEVLQLQRIAETVVLGPLRGLWRA
jgi:hypothetical protein